MVTVPAGGPCASLPALPDATLLHSQQRQPIVCTAAPGL